MKAASSSTNTYIVIGLFIFTLIIVIIYAILVIFMFVGKWGLFATYEPPIPGSPDTVFRPGGTPEPLTSDEIQERQKFAQALVKIIAGTTPT